MLRDSSCDDMSDEGEKEDNGKPTREKFVWPTEVLHAPLLPRRRGLGSRVQNWPLAFSEER
jgi:hypothetical protein